MLQNEYVDKVIVDREDDFYYKSKIKEARW